MFSSAVGWIFLRLMPAEKRVESDVQDTCKLRRAPGRVIHCINFDRFAFFMYGLAG